MVCMNCKKIVSDGLFCSICGWDQRKDPARCTLNEVHNRWKKRNANCKCKLDTRTVKIS